MNYKKTYRECWSHRGNAGQPRNFMYLFCFAFCYAFLGLKQDLVGVLLACRAPVNLWTEKFIYEISYREGYKCFWHQKAVFLVGVLAARQRQCNLWTTTKFCTRTHIGIMEIFGTCSVDSWIETKGRFSPCPQYLYPVSLPIRRLTIHRLTILFSWRVQTMNRHWSLAIKSVSVTPKQSFSLKRKISKTSILLYGFQ